MTMKYREDTRLRSGQVYETDLTDDEWAIVGPLLPKSEGSGKAQQIELRRIVNAILYITRTGCQWRLLPKDFPKWQSVYYHFAKWRDDHTWERMNDDLAKMVRVKAGRDPNPSMLLVDSQSVKSTESTGTRAFDGGKRIKGTKRHFAVDTMGLIHGLYVTAANVDDRIGAEEMLSGLRGALPRLTKVLADGGYRGDYLESWIEQQLHAALEVVTVEKGQKTFIVQAWRWVVERTISWVNRNRRLSKDYEYLVGTAESFIFISMATLMLKRLVV